MSKTATFTCQECRTEATPGKHHCYDTCRAEKAERERDEALDVVRRLKSYREADEHVKELANARAVKAEATNARLTAALRHAQALAHVAHPCELAVSRLDDCQEAICIHLRAALTPEPPTPAAKYKRWLADEEAALTPKPPKEPPTTALFLDGEDTGLRLEYPSEEPPCKCGGSGFVDGADNRTIVAEPCPCTKEPNGD